MQEEKEKYLYIIEFYLWLKIIMKKIRIKNILLQIIMEKKWIITIIEGISGML